MYIKLPILDEEGHPIIIQFGKTILGSANSWVGVNLDVEMADNECCLYSYRQRSRMRTILDEIADYKQRILRRFL